MPASQLDNNACKPPKRTSAIQLLLFGLGLLTASACDTAPDESLQRQLTSKNKQQQN